MKKLILFLFLPLLSFGQSTFTDAVRRHQCDTVFYPVYKHDTITIVSTVYETDTIFVAVHDTVKIPCDTVVVDTTGGDTVVVTPKDTVWRGLYINSYNNIYNSTSALNALIADLNRWNINSIHLYGLSSIPSSANATLQNSFIQIRRRTHVTDIVATGGSGSTFTGSRTTYNKASPDSGDFDSWDLENEPWNAADVATAWAQDKQYLVDMKNGMSAGQVEASVQYFGWWTKAPMTTEAAPALVQYTTYGLIHDYRTAPDWAYMRSRMNDLNTAARSQGKVFTVRVIFSAEPAFMQGYYSTHTLDQAYYALYSGFAGEHYTNLKLDGYLIFHLDFLRVSQPNAPAARVIGPMAAPPAPLFADPEFENITTSDHLKMSEPR